MSAIADTSFVLALLIKTDRRREDCLAIYKAQDDRIYLPQSTLNEVAYLLGSIEGSRGVAQFLNSLPNTKYDLMPLLAEDLARTADLLTTYHDSRLDFVDASIAAMAERLSITQVLTLDHRDFSIIRPAHAPHFDLLPAPKP